MQTICSGHDSAARTVASQKTWASSHNGVNTATRSTYWLTQAQDATE